MKYDINFTGTAGSRVAGSVLNGEIEFYPSSSDVYKEGGKFNATGSTYTHHMYLGSVAITRRGGRRYCQINQVRSGKIFGVQNYNTTQSGSATDPNTTADQTRSGIREVIMCLNGKPFTTFILTGPLSQLT